MRKIILAACMTVAGAGAASAQTVIATDPFTGAVTGTNAGFYEGARVAGPVGAIVGAPIGFVTGALAGTVGAVGTVAGALVGAPAYGYGYAPGYAYPVATGSTTVSYGYREAYPMRRTVRVAYAEPRRAVSYRRVAYRNRGGYRVVSYRGQRMAMQRGYRPATVRRGGQRMAMQHHRGHRTMMRSARYQDRAMGMRQVGQRSGRASGHMGHMMHGGRSY